jgi:hypothetical protein
MLRLVASARAALITRPGQPNLIVSGGKGAPHVTIRCATEDPANHIGDEERRQRAEPTAATMIQDCVVPVGRLSIATIVLALEMPGYRARELPRRRPPALSIEPFCVIWSRPDRGRVVPMGIAGSVRGLEQSRQPGLL